MSLDRRSPASIACERDSIVRGGSCGILDLTVGELHGCIPICWRGISFLLRPDDTVSQKFLSLLPFFTFLILDGIFSYALSVSAEFQLLILLKRVRIIDQFFPFICKLQNNCDEYIIFTKLYHPSSTFLKTTVRFNQRALSP